MSKNIKKVIYKDEVYYYYEYIHPKWETINSSLNLYIKNTGWAALIKKYKHIGGRFNLSRNEARDKDTFRSIIDEWRAKQQISVLTIDCSPEVERMYKEN